MRPPAVIHCLLGGNAAADAAGDIPALRFVPNGHAKELDLFITAEDTTSLVLRPVFRRRREPNSDYADLDQQFEDSGQDITLSAAQSVRRRIEVTPGMEVGLRVQTFTGGAAKKATAFGVLIGDV